MPDPSDPRVALQQESERLKKLYAAYETQEKEFQALKQKFADLHSELEGKDRIVKTLKDLMASRDRGNREMEIELTAHRQDKADWDPKIRDLQAQLRAEKERFAKLFALAEELDEELRHAKREVEARDEWFRTHMDGIRNMGEVIEEWDRRIEAVTVRKSAPGFEATLKKLNEPKIQ